MSTAGAEKNSLHMALPVDILAGKVTDVYFERTRQILEHRGRRARVVAEIVLKKFPDDYTWGLFTGLEEALAIFEKLPVTVRSLPEGTLFYEEEPVLEISGDYLDFGRFETAILGFLCQTSGVATRAARCKKAAAGRPIISFGARRMHPAIAPMIERAAYIGGCDGVASIAAAELLGISPSGTMPHALILILGDTLEAIRAFDEIVDPTVFNLERCACGGRLESLLVPIVDNGKLIYQSPAPQQIRESVLRQLEQVEG